jgi:hypothetical protein
MVRRRFIWGHKLRTARYACGRHVGRKRELTGSESVIVELPLYRQTYQEIGNGHKITIGCELVGNELDIVEVHAHDIGEDDNGLLSALVLRVGDVSPDCVYQYM